MATLNPAVQAHLRRIIDTERSRTLRWGLWLRAAFISLSTLQSAWAVRTGAAPEAAPTMPVMLAWVCVAWVSAMACERLPALRRVAGLSVGLLDIPLATLAAWLAIPAMSAATRPYLLNSLLPSLAALVVATVLALDAVAIAVATLSALASCAVGVLAVGEPLIELQDPSFALLCTGVLCLVIVSRLQSLVAESRRRDFAGKYVLGQRVGAGGMAEVFTATYSPEGGFERKVALKRILPAYAADAALMALFRREAQIGAQLAHPNLVQVLDFGRHEDSWFLVMELVDGTSLAEVLKGPTLPLSAGLYVLAEVAEGLAYLHEKRSPDGANVGLLHRDLNPPNVLVSGNAEVKISDFGIARWHDSDPLTATGVVRGKLAYLAPELLGGSQATPATDLFALGATAHEVLTGQRLFSAPADAELLQQVLTRPIPRVSSLRQQVPAAVDEAVATLLERDPARRALTARQLSLVLRSVAGPDAPYPGGRDALLQALRK